MNAIALRKLMVSGECMLTIILLLSGSIAQGQFPPQTDPCQRNVLEFDGTNDYITVNGNSTINGTEGTWEAWVRKDDWTQSGYQHEVLVGNGINHSTTNSFYVSFHATVGLHFRYNKNDATGAAIFPGNFNATSGFSPGSWHHIAITWKPSSNPAETDLAIILDGTELVNGKAPSVISMGSTLNFGFSTNFTDMSYHSGSLADIRTWDVARTAGEITADMNSYLQGNEAGLTGYWPMDDGSGSTAATNLVSGAPDGALLNFDVMNDWVVDDTPTMEIISATKISNGESYDFSFIEVGSSSGDTTFTIQNHNKQTLVLNGSPIVELSGANAAEFSVDLTATSSTLAQDATTNFTVRFDPNSEGTKAAVLTILSDDVCDDTYTINLTGEGIVTTAPDGVITSKSGTCIEESLTLEISGGNKIPEASWVWYKDTCGGTSIGEGTSITIIPTGTAQYFVRAELDGTPLTTCTLSEVVTWSPATAVTIVSQPKATRMVTEGENFTTSVIAAGNPTYQWQKDGEDLVNDVRTSGANTSELTIASIQPADAGIYTCTISNDCGSVQTNDVNLTTTTTSSMVLPYAEDFESGDGGYVAAGQNSSWVLHEGSDFNSTFLWQQALDAANNNYLFNNNEQSTLTSPLFVIPESLDGADVAFDFYIGADLNDLRDGAILEVSDDEGVSWNKVTDFIFTDGLVRNGYATPGKNSSFEDVPINAPWWVTEGPGRVDWDISEYVGSGIMFRIFFASDATNNSYVGCGFDNVSLIETNTTPPIGLISSASQTTANNAAITIDIVFSEEIAALVPGDFLVTNGMLSNIQTADNQNFTASLTPLSEGIVNVKFQPESEVEDLDGNGLLESNELNIYNAVTGPKPTLVAEIPALITAPFTTTIYFDTEITSFSSSDINVTNASLSDFQTINPGHIYSVMVSPENQGSVTLEVINGVTTGVIGNLTNVMSNQINTEYDENDPPVLSPIGNRMVDEESTLNFTASATDPDPIPNELAFSLDAVSISKGMSINSSNGVFNWDPSESDDGDHTVTITVTDDGTGNLSDEETFTITVNEINTEPVLSDVGDKEINELVELNFTVSATDADIPGNTLTFSLDGVSTGKGMTIDASTGDFSWTPSESQDEDHNVTVSVTDNGAGNFSDQETFTITVNEVNLAPQVGAIENFEIQLGDQLQFSVSASDTDLPAQTITYSLDAASGTKGMTIDQAGDFEWTTKSGDAESHPVEISVSDGEVETTVSFNINVLKLDQTINFDAIEDKTFGDATFDLTASGGESGNPITFTSSDESVASISGSTVTIIGAGTTTITADQEGNVDFNPATPVEQTLTVAKASLTITADNQNRIYNSDNPVLTISYGSFIGSDTEADLDVLPSASTIATQTSDVGTYPITLTGGSDDNYELTMVDGILTIAKADQLITFNEITDIDLLSTNTVSLDAASDASLPVTFTLLEGDGSVDGTTLIVNNTGNFTVEATQSGNMNYNAAIRVTQNFMVTDSRKDDQTITFETITGKTYGDGTFDLSATASSGLGVIYTSSDETVATIAGNTVNILGAGSTIITADQDGDADFNPATSVDQTLTIEKARLTATADDQVITFGEALPTLSIEYAGFVNGDTEAVIDIVPTASTEATGNGGSDAGAYPIALSDGADDNYVLTLVDGTLTINKADQEIAFDAIPDIDIANTTSVSLTATSDATLPVAFTLIEGDGTIGGSTLTVNSAGEFTVEASQSGNVNYNAATMVTQSFIATDSRKDDQTIDFPAISDKTFGDVFDLTATASSNLQVTYEVLSGSAIIVGSEVTITGAGMITIEASQGGDNSFNAAASVTQSFVAGKLTLTVTADDQTRIYNTDNPTLTISYGGFNGSDTEADLAIVPSASATATLDSDVGTYPISVTGGVDNNYDFQYVMGSLIITKATASITLSNLEQEVDGTTKEPTVVTDPANLTYTLIWLGGVAPSTAGDHDFMVTVDETNYEGEESGTLTLTSVLGLTDTPIKIYPNPAQDYLIIESIESLEVELIGLDGRLLLRGNSSDQIDISTISNGVLLLRMTNNNGESKTIRFLKNTE